jgi:nucleoside-diphosphate-sugar epimerase
MKLLITGGAGFIGTHLSNYLINGGHAVTVVDNLVTGNKGGLHPQIKFIESAIEGWEIVGDYDMIYHLASIADYDKYIANPMDTFNANVKGVQNVVRYAEQSGCRVVYTSSSEVYGSIDIPMAEDKFSGVNPYSVKSAYTEGKRASETLCKLSSAHITVVRLFNVYGKGMIDRVIHDFSKCIRNGNPVKIYGTGNQVRSFTFISDVINALAMNLPNDVFNIGNPEPVMIIELAQMVADTLGLKLNTEYYSSRIDEPFSRIPSIEKIKLLGWEPSVDLKEGLSLMLAGESHE